MIVCICRVVSDRTIRHAVAAGASSVAEVAARTGAGSCCGACRPQVAEIVKECRGSCADCPRGRDEVASSPYLASVGEAA